MFKLQVIVDSTNTWGAGNGLTFKTWGAAKSYALDLASRWPAVRSWRIVDDNDVAVKGEPVDELSQDVLCGTRHT